MWFRNCHFASLVKHDDGALYALVTDAGYACEPSVVWERLCDETAVGGDTVLCDANFAPAYQQHPTTAAPAPAVAWAPAAGGDNDDAALMMALAMAAEDSGHGAAAAAHFGANSEWSSSAMQPMICD